MNLEEKLKSLGFTLPSAPAAAANYVPYTMHSGLVYVAGQIPFVNGESHYVGKLGDTISFEDGVEAAQICALNILAQVNAAVSGDWSRVEKCLKLGGFVNCTPDFTDHAKIINGASDLIGHVMGKNGQHARFAVGAPSLPFDVAVEIDAVFAVA